MFVKYSFELGSTYVLPVLNHFKTTARFYLDEAYRRYDALIRL
jgi:hypothetical protein